MRCKNCGWDNPNGNAKCEKCNALLDSAVSDNRTPHYRNAQDEYATPRATVASCSQEDHTMPRATVAAFAQGDYSAPRATVAAFAQDDQHLRATITGCASCGYPVRPEDVDCPVCGARIAEYKKAPDTEKATVKSAMPMGTIIQGENFDKENADTERRKLTGFLVSYDNAPNGEHFLLYEGKNYIGRDASSNVVIQGDASVSERHLSILYRTVDRKFKFKDEQSSNGTFVNGELTDEGILKNFDLIRIGSTRLLFIEIPLSSFE